MENNAIYILKTFSKDDIKRFGEFLNSPFHNKSRKLLKLYNALIKFHPEFNSKFLSEKRLSKSIDPGLEYNKFTLNRLFFDLYHCEEKYLMIKNLESNPVESQNLQRDEFFRKKLYKLIDKNIYSVRKELESGNNINSDHYLNMYRLYTDIYNLDMMVSSKSNKGNIDKKLKVLTERGKYITYFFVTEMIMEYENLITYGITYNLDKKLNFIFDIFSNFNLPKLLKMLILNSENSIYSANLKLYLAMLMTFSNPDNEKYYFEYKKQLLFNINSLSTDQKRFHFGNLIRYCIMKRGVIHFYDKFNNELFKLYKFILSNENYRSNATGYISVDFYRNILLHSLRLKKYKWVVLFIKKYSGYLDPNKRENIYYYSMSLYYFHRKLFRDARNYLHKINFDEFVYKIDYKKLMLMIYFELKEYESAIDLIDSFRHFLAKDITLSGEFVKRHKNFISIVKNLILYKTKSNKISTYYLEKGFDNNLPYSNWVKEKIIELDIKGIKN